MTLEERFWKRVHKTNTCWLWTGGKHDFGYGIFSLTRTTHMYAHRYSYELHYGPIPDGLWVLHRCDTPACVRPSCLWLGTHADNQADKVAKGRGRGPRFSGEDHPGAKLTAAQVHAIRERYATERISGVQLAREYGVRPTNISAILLGQSWTDTFTGRPVVRHYKLTSAERDTIRQRYRAGGVTQQQLADEFGVTQSTVYKIARR